MNEQTVITLVATVCALLGGAFGVKLLDRWFDRDKDQSARAFTDNEQARVFLSRELKERDEELGAIRASERALLKQVGELQSQVSRMEERGNAHTSQIDELKAAVAKWGIDYAEMKRERDEYRTAKHATDQRLTVESLGRQLSEKDNVMLRAEIDQLKGQLAALANRHE